MGERVSKAGTRVRDPLVLIVRCSLNSELIAIII